MHSAIGDDQRKMVVMLFNTVHDMERIGDHADNLREIVQYKLDNKVSFSNYAMEELREIYKNVEQAMDNAFLALSTKETAYVKAVDTYEKKVDELRDSFRESHISRINKGECNINAGVLFLEILTNLERISDHCVNVADVVRIVDKSKLKLDRASGISPEKC